MACPTCLGLLKEWYGIRRELEDWWLLPPPNNDPTAFSEGGDDLNIRQSFYRNDETIDQVKQSRTGALDHSQYFGYCDEIGTDGYRRLVKPDGHKT